MPRNVRPALLLSSILWAGCANACLVTSDSSSEAQQQGCQVGEAPAVIPAASTEEPQDDDDELVCPVSDKHAYLSDPGAEEDSTEFSQDEPHEPSAWCWYAEKRFSEGAIYVVKQDGFLLPLLCSKDGSGLKWISSRLVDNDPAPPEKVAKNIHKKGLGELPN